LPQELSAAAKKKAKRKAKEKAAKAGAGAEAAAVEKLAAEKPGKGKKMSAAVRAMQEAQEARQRAEEAARVAEEERKRQVGPENRYRYRKPFNFRICQTLSYDGCNGRQKARPPAKEGQAAGGVQVADVCR